MALTDTTASKKFIAGAPDIILKGDYRRKKPDMKIASDDMNERFLEQLYEQLLDEGFSPEEAAKKARQGVAYSVQEDIKVVDPKTLENVPMDGETIGEVFTRGNITMKGYLKNEKATNEAFNNGWFHTGDLGVWHSDGYVQLKDRSKDIIISGGENISSIEVEDALYKHPDVVAVGVVAKQDEKWGETPCAFVELREGANVSSEELRLHCKSILAGFKVPGEFKFIEIPKTSTGKIQKFKLREMLT